MAVAVAVAALTPDTVLGLAIRRHGLAVAAVMVIALVIVSGANSELPRQPVLR